MAPVFDAPVPGEAMTAELGARPWQQPAQYTTVEEALDFYESAFSVSENNFTSPKFLLKAANVASYLNNKNKASDYYSIIKKDYPKSSESNLIDIQIEKNSVK